MVKIPDAYDKQRFSRVEQTKNIIPLVWQMKTIGIVLNPSKNWVNIKKGGNASPKEAFDDAAVKIQEFVSER